jgi:hypothetical protein
VLQDRRPGHAVQAVGFMPEAVSAAVAARLGSEPSRLMVVGEKQLVHADSEKHRRDDIVLTPDEFKRLPQMINDPEAVLWEADDQVLILVYPAEDGRKIKVVMRLDYKLKKQPQPLDVVINAFKVPKEALQNQGVYEVLQERVGAP